MNYKILFIATAAACVMSMSAFAATTTQDFVHKASIAGKFEVDSSKLALQKSSDSDLKAVAQMMIDDHTKANNELKETLEKNNIDAQPETELDRKHQKLMAKLQSASPETFDKKYISIQTDAHKEAIHLFTDYSKNGADAPLKDFAANTLPTLKKHLSHIAGLK